MTEQSKPENKCIDVSTIMETVSNNSDLINVGINASIAYFAYRTMKNSEK